MSKSQDTSGENKPDNIDDKIREIQDRIKILYEKRISLPDNATEKPDPISDIIRKKAGSLIQDVQQGKNPVVDSQSGEKERILSGADGQLSGDTKTDSKSLVQEKGEYQTDVSDDIGSRLDNLNNQIEGLNPELKPEEIIDGKTEIISAPAQDKLPQKLFDSFYNEKTDNINEDKEVKDPQHVNVVKDRLEKMEDKINQIKDGLTSIDTKNITIHNETNYTVPAGKIVESHEKIVDRIHVDKEGTDKKISYKHGPIMLRPKEKKAGLFNDINLTEDYELGFRFYQLGFKTGFFNVKLDDQDESSRIATAEFFPNRFWTSVKQRSRWVAGIVFQNWAAHKWNGSIATKYFLFRDRKSFFSFFGAFLSNILLIYLIVSLILKAMGYYNMYSLVGHSSVLWYLMIANLLFMVSRLSHRFIFTYNWYGLGYAFFSLFRLPLDTVINFFAIARSMSVYRNTKSQKKVVWDSTSHY